ncbi:MAG: InlB B-repeat-containing protein [Coriobacteriia bacterium]|nr:InlB B-repeat-containing protein [Coriobacteriia bacterium]
MKKSSKLWAILLTVALSLVLLPAGFAFASEEGDQQSLLTTSSTSDIDKSAFLETIEIAQDVLGNKDDYLVVGTTDTYDENYWREQLAGYVTLAQMILSFPDSTPGLQETLDTAVNEVFPEIMSHFEKIEIADPRTLLVGVESMTTTRFTFESSAVVSDGDGTLSLEVDAVSNPGGIAFMNIVFKVANVPAGKTLVCDFGWQSAGQALEEISFSPINKMNLVAVGGDLFRSPHNNTHLMTTNMNASSAVYRLSIDGVVIGTFVISYTGPIVTVTYDSDGGTAVAPASVNYGNWVSEPAKPTKEGHSFIGWYLDDESFVFGVVYGVRVTSDITLVARWNANTYTVSFDSDGGSLVLPLSVQYPASATQPADPQKEGYNFLGWYLDDAQFDFNATITANITLTAKWEKEPVPLPVIVSITEPYFEGIEGEFTNDGAGNFTAVYNVAGIDGALRTFPIFGIDNVSIRNFQVGIVSTVTNRSYSMALYDYAAGQYRLDNLYNASWPATSRDGNFYYEIYFNDAGTLKLIGTYTISLVEEEEPEPTATYTITYYNFFGSPCDSEVVEEGTILSLPTDFSDTIKWGLAYKQAQGEDFTGNWLAWVGGLWVPFEATTAISANWILMPECKPVNTLYTVDFEDVYGVTVQYYTNISGWKTVGVFDSTSTFSIPDQDKSTFGPTTIRVYKGGMTYTFDNVDTSSGAVVTLTVPIKELWVMGVWCDGCTLSVVQNNWVYQNLVPVVSGTTVFKVFDNGGNYQVNLNKSGFHTVIRNAVLGDGVLYVYLADSVFYQTQVPEGVSNVRMQSNNWIYPMPAKAGDIIDLLKTDKSAKMTFDYNGSSYSVDFILNGSDPFISIR